MEKCTHEIGSIKKGWHPCNRTATKEYNVTVIQSLTSHRLAYCEKHQVERRLSCRYEMRFINEPAIMPFVTV